VGEEAGILCGDHRAEECGVDIVDIDPLLVDADGIAAPCAFGHADQHQRCKGRIDKAIEDHDGDRAEDEEGDQPTDPAEDTFDHDADECSIGGEFAPRRLRCLPRGPAGGRRM
jgi:hypothetical protein